MTDSQLQFHVFDRVGKDLRDDISAHVVLDVTAPVCHTMQLISPKLNQIRNRLIDQLYE
jgi:hypothetical protein